MDSEYFFFYLAGVVVGIIILVFVIRWTLRIDTIVSNQRATISFLIKMCRQQGVPENEITTLKDKFEVE